MFKTPNQKIQDLMASLDKIISKVDKLQTTMHDIKVILDSDIDPTTKTSMIQDVIDG